MSSASFPALDLPSNDSETASLVHNVCKMLDISSFNQYTNEILPGKFLTILCINIRSIRKNFAQLQVLLSMLHVKFDLILLVETWLDKNVNNGFELPSYISYDTFRNSQGGGVKLYVDCLFQSVKIDNLSCRNNCFESLFVDVTLSSDLTVTIGCIYRIPSSSITEFNEIFFENYLQQINRNKIVILGDLNINLYNRESNPTNKYLNNFLSSNFSPLIYYPTRVNPGDVTRYALLDHIFTNIHESTTFSAVLEYQITDHFPIAGFIPVNNSNKCKTKTFHVRPVNNRKIKKFCDSLRDFVNDFRFESHMSPDDNFTAFTNSLYQIYYQCFPLKEINRNALRGLRAKFENASIKRAHFTICSGVVKFLNLITEIIAIF